jgi:hypothetical protein
LKVSGDFSPDPDAKSPRAQRIFVVTRRGDEVAPKVNRVVILIECKSATNAIKSLLHSMPDIPIHAEQLTRSVASSRGGAVLALVRLSLGQAVDGIGATGLLLAAGKASGIPVTILGNYPGSDDGG